MMTTETFSDAFMIRESDLREALVSFFDENGFALRALATDEHFARRLRAQEKADELMTALNRRRLAFGSAD